MVVTGRRPAQYEHAGPRRQFVSMEVGPIRHGGGLAWPEERRVAMQRAHSFLAMPCEDAEALDVNIPVGMPWESRWHRPPSSTHAHIVRLHVADATLELMRVIRVEVDKGVAQQRLDAMRV